MYPRFAEQTITDFTNSNIESMYDRGFVFTRLGRGVMQRVNSLRVDLSKFELSSENRRILRKTESLGVEVRTLPLAEYTWEIGKLAKDFYTQKFGDKIMSANKIREMFIDPEKSNMNGVFVYSNSNSPQPPLALRGGETVSPLADKGRLGGVTNKNWVAYCLCYVSDKIIHYSYPFYKLQGLPLVPEANSYKLPVGMGMMLKAIMWAKDHDKQYIYLGTDQPYKHQFKGVEVFNRQEWIIV